MSNQAQIPVTAQGLKDAMDELYPNNGYKISDYEGLLKNPANVEWMASKGNPEEAAKALYATWSYTY